MPKIDNATIGRSINALNYMALRSDRITPGFWHLTINSRLRLVEILFSFGDESKPSFHFVIPFDQLKDKWAGWIPFLENQWARLEVLIYEGLNDRKEAIRRSPEFRRSLANYVYKPKRMGEPLPGGDRAIESGGREPARTSDHKRRTDEPSGHPKLLRPKSGRRRTDNVPRNPNGEA